MNDDFEYFYEILNNAIKKYIPLVKIKCKTNKPNGGMPICFVATENVNWFNETKGFGFLKPDGGGSDVYVHFAEIRSEGSKTLAGNQHVSFDIG